MFLDRPIDVGKNGSEELDPVKSPCIWMSHEVQKRKKKTGDGLLGTDAKSRETELCKLLQPLASHLTRVHTTHFVISLTAMIRTKTLDALWGHVTEPVPSQRLCRDRCHLAHGSATQPLP